MNKIKKKGKGNIPKRKTICVSLDALPLKIIANKKYKSKEKYLWIQEQYDVLLIIKKIDFGLFKLVKYYFDILFDDVGR